MNVGAITSWIAGHAGLSVVAAFFLLGILVNFVQATFYAWYVMAVAVAFAIAAVSGGTLYFYAFLLGMITAFAEIIGKFRDEPLKSLQTPQAILYHLLNGAISAFALKVYFLTFGEATTQMDQIKAVTTAGFGSMLLMRSKFFNAKVGDQDISFGPEQIIKVFLSFMESAIDRIRAQSRVDFVRTNFRNLRFETVKPYCDSMLDAAQLLGDRRALTQALKEIADDATLDTQLKSYRLGFLLLDRMGEDFVTKLIERRPDDDPAWYIKAPDNEKKTDGLLSRLPFKQPKPDSIPYLAYGSSMSTDRFRERLNWSRSDVARFVESTIPQPCNVEGYSLAFNKLDKGTMSGTANLVAGGGQPAEGVVYFLTGAQLNFLQGSEDGYRLKTVTVKVGDKTLPAQAFVAVSPRDGLKPAKAYLQALIDGAREHQLSPEYIAALEATETISDISGDVVSAFERRIEEAASAGVSSVRR